MAKFNGRLNRRNFLLAVGATAGAVAIEACTSAPSAPAAIPGAVAPVSAAPRPLFAMTGASASLTIQPAIANTLLGMHPKLGWYKEEGIDAKYIGADGGLNGLRLIQTKQITTGMANHDAIFGLAAKGEDPGATLFFQFGYVIAVRIAVLPGSPITTLQQLKGKQIGVALGGSNHTFSAQVLKNLGIDPLKDVTFVSTPGAAGAQALKDGKIDAYASFDADFAALQLQFGFTMRFLPWPDYVDKLHIGSTLAVSNDFMRDNPAMVASIGRVAAKGVVFMGANPQAAIELFWDLFPETLPKGITRAEATKSQLPGIIERARIQVPAGRPLELGYMEPEAWKTYTEEFLQYRQIDATKFYTNKFVADINKFDHDAIAKLAKSF